jgi:hypothetical protein
MNNTNTHTITDTHIGEYSVSEIDLAAEAGDLTPFYHALIQFVPKDIFWEIRSKLKALRPSSAPYPIVITETEKEIK